jgi:hypothetical protein
MARAEKAGKPLQRKKNGATVRMTSDAIEAARAQQLEEGVDAERVSRGFIEIPNNPKSIAAYLKQGYRQVSGSDASEPVEARSARATQPERIVETKGRKADKTAE